MHKTTLRLGVLFAADAALSLLGRTGGCGAWTVVMAQAATRNEIAELRAQRIVDRVHAELERLPATAHIEAVAELFRRFKRDAELPHPEPEVSDVMDELAVTLTARIIGDELLYAAANVVGT